MRRCLGLVPGQGPVGLGRIMVEQPLQVTRAKSRRIVTNELVERLELELELPGPPVDMLLFDRILQIF
jgi:hypothetical protein